MDPLQDKLKSAEKKSTAASVLSETLLQQVSDVRRHCSEVLQEQTHLLPAMLETQSAEINTNVSASIAALQQLLESQRTQLQGTQDELVQSF